MESVRLANLRQFAAFASQTFVVCINGKKRGLRAPSVCRCAFVFLQLLERRRVVIGFAEELHGFGVSNCLGHFHGERLGIRR